MSGFESARSHLYRNPRDRVRPLIAAASFVTEVANT